MFITPTAHLHAIFQKNLPQQKLFSPGEYTRGKRFGASNPASPPCIHGGLNGIHGGLNGIHGGLNGMSPLSLWEMGLELAISKHVLSV